MTNEPAQPPLLGRSYTWKIDLKVALVQGINQYDQLNKDEWPCTKVFRISLKFQPFQPK